MKPLFSLNVFFMQQYFFNATSAGNMKVFPKGNTQNVRPGIKLQVIVAIKCGVEETN